MKFVANLKKSVLGSMKSSLGGYPQKHSFWSLLDLSNVTLKSKIRLIV